MLKIWFESASWCPTTFNAPYNIQNVAAMSLIKSGGT